MVYLLIIIAILVVAYFLGVFYGAPFLVSFQETVAQIITAAEIRPGEKLADLGSGDGRILIAAAKAGAEAHGYEINPILVFWSRLRIRKAGLSDRAKVHWKNFWFADLSGFDIVVVFGVTQIMPRLEKKLQKEFRSGARVISNIFQFPIWVGEKKGSVIVYKK